MIADPSYAIVTSALGQLRLHLANRLGLIPENSFYPVWITEFPLFEATEEGGVTSSHHPFTAPDRTDFDPKNIEELLTLRSRAYDLVMNGEELGGGSIRINNRDRAAQNICRAGTDRRRNKRKIRLLPAGFRFRRAAARRPGAGHGPHRVDDSANSVHPRGDRISQKPQRRLSPDRRTLRR